MHAMSIPSRWMSGFGPTSVCAALLVLAGLGGCVPDGITDYDYKQHQPPSTLPEERGNVLVGEAETSGVRVALFIDKGAHTGYNRLRVRLSDATSEAAIGEARVTFAPRYTREGEAWEVPFEDPTSTQADDEGFFEGAAFFLPPESEAGQFALDVAFDAGGRSGAVTFPLDVRESLWMQRVETAAGRYFVSWVHPERPAVGENVFEVTLHRETEGGYAPLTSAALDLYPYMDMGGGDGHSTPYEATVHAGEGRYRGTVDFIMSGGWDMTVYVRREGAATDTVLFEDYTVY